MLSYERLLQILTKLDKPESDYVLAFILNNERKAIQKRDQINRQLEELEREKAEVGREQAKVKKEGEKWTRTELRRLQADEQFIQQLTALRKALKEKPLAQHSRLLTRITERLERDSPSECPPVQ